MSAFDSKNGQSASPRLLSVGKQRTKNRDEREVKKIKKVLTIIY